MTTSDWIRLHLPNWGHIGRYLLWGVGRVGFSLWFFSLTSFKVSCKTLIAVLEMTERGTHHLLAVYSQLPYMGTLTSKVIDIAALPVVEPDNVISDLLRGLEGKHCLIVGDTGTGKSTIAQWLSYQIGGEVKVYDPDASPDEWVGLNVVGRRGNFEAIAASMAEDLEELQRRIELRGESGDRSLAGLDSVLIAEEFPLLKDEVEIASEWLVKHARRGRKPKRFIIALAQDDNVKTLGIEGEGSVRKCFRMLRLGKFAVTHAKSLKDTALVEWLKAGKYRCTVDDLPCQLPDLSSYKMVMPRLQSSVVSEAVVTAETTADSGFQPAKIGDETLAKAVKACLEAGLSESKVIKEVLGYQGSKYQEGKQILEILKSQIETST